MSDRVILAYSGGLDTSVAISWIGKETGREVVAVAIDLGQGGEDMEVVRPRPLDCGAVGAPQSSARCRTTSMSSPPWPRSMATATTSRPVSLPIQLIATEVSRPPEYARMTRSDMSLSPLRASAHRY